MTWGNKYDPLIKHVVSPSGIRYRRVYRDPASPYETKSNRHTEITYENAHRRRNPDAIDHEEDHD